MSFSAAVRRHIKRPLYTGTEQLWHLWFYLAGVLVRSTVQHVDFNDTRKVLVIAPHPDDEALGCAGTLMLHKEAGAEVCVVHVTDGRQSRAIGLSGEAMAEQRKKESVEAAKNWSIDRLIWLGLPEGNWETKDLQSHLHNAFKSFNPDVVYVPSGIDFHPEHLKVTAGIATLFEEQISTRRSLPQVRIFQMQTPLTGVLTNLVADVSSHYGTIEKIFRCYVSQQENLPRSLRMRRYASGYYKVGTLMEEFFALSAQDYCLLHKALEQSLLARPFRGLRYRPFSDPLAYFQGRRIRNNLKLSSTTAHSEVEPPG